MTNRYEILFYSALKDGVWEDPDYLRIDKAAGDRLTDFGGVKTKRMVNDKLYSVYTFRSLDDALKFRESPEHQEAMRNVGRFYADWDVKRQWVEND